MRARIPLIAGLLLCLSLNSACREVIQAFRPDSAAQEQTPDQPVPDKTPDPSGADAPLTGSVSKPKGEQVPLEQLPDTAFIRLVDYSDQFSYDLRYAGVNNFLGEAVYDCGECYLRVNTARALIQANQEFREKGLHLLLFDCYRPQSVQYQMWELMPDPHYVARPEKGSIHNRGGAVDLTLAGADGQALDMGTDFDHFGEEAHHDYSGLPESVLENRRLLRTVMEKYGFWTIRTEWWHYNLDAASLYPNADFRWDCP